MRSVLIVTSGITARTSHGGAAQGNCRIRKVSSFGTISTIAGNGTCGISGDGGPATSAELNEPVGVAVDSAGNVYISDAVSDCGDPTLTAFGRREALASCERVACRVAAQRRESHACALRRITNAFDSSPTLRRRLP